MRILSPRPQFKIYIKAFALFVSASFGSSVAAAQTSTTTSVTFSTTQVYQGDTPNAFVTVSASGGGYPDGSASCALAARGHNSAFSASLNNGSAAIPIQSVSQLAVGSYSISCYYSGSLTYAQSSTPATTLQVIALPQAHWVADGNMSVARGGQTATSLPNGQVLLAGGVSNGGTLLNTAEVYNPSTQSTSATQNTMQVPRERPTATLLQTGKVLVAGGLYTTGNARPAAMDANYPMSDSTQSDPGSELHFPRITLPIHHNCRSLRPFEQQLFCYRSYERRPLRCYRDDVDGWHSAHRKWFR